MPNTVILVDEKDKELGTMEKLQAHQTGRLHRAFSIFVFNDKNEVLLQQRAMEKYHSGGKWANTCCSHPLSSDVLKDAHVRLVEEMGFDCKLKEAFTFIYRAKLDSGLTEYELDHVIIGHSNKMPTLNPAEVMDYRYMTVKDLKADIKSNPDQYAYWLKEAIKSPYFSEM
jgi:isopentenyl-diphosphate Delta-isomerase